MFRSLSGLFMIFLPVLSLQDVFFYLSGINIYSDDFTGDHRKARSLRITKNLPGM
jgi:hypothetical protein